jgi:hypothetical protein
VATVSSTYEEEDRGYGWLVFAATMLGLAGILSVIDGIVGLSKSRFYTNNATYVFSDLRTWAWITLIIGVVAQTHCLTFRSVRFTKSPGRHAPGLSLLEEQPRAGQSRSQVHVRRGTPPHTRQRTVRRSSMCAVTPFVNISTPASDVAAKTAAS